MKVITTKSLRETQAFAIEYLNSLTSSTEQATIIGLYGNLGSGKTAFTKCLAKELGIHEVITSPTFVIMKLYETKNEKFKRLIHIDAYRLESGKELQILDFESLVNNKNNLIVIEWPENVKEILTKDHKKIHCSFIDENTRQYDVE
jgi:tRNA threonylcarbamoyladenosine biosynthesis protein TsaE